MPFPEYSCYDALGLADLIRRREVSAAEVVEEAIARIEARNGAVNAVVQRSYDRARARARDGVRDGLFAGVPFLLKDLLATEEGIPTTYGCRAFQREPARCDSEIVVRQRRAGLVVVGKTNTSEFGILPVTEPVLHGITRNPWDPKRSAGGSSGGAAAAVAAGMVPLAHGSDGGGSIRIPASCCGVFGLKPTRARNPMGPEVGEGWHGISVEHGISRSVRDSAALLDATHGPDPGAPYHAPPPERSYLEEVARPPGRLRIAFTARSLLGRSVHPDCVEAVKSAAELCASLGHDVTEAEPPLDRGALRRAFLTLTSAETAAAIDDAVAALRRPLRAREFEPGTWFFAQVGRARTAAELASAVHVIHAAGRKLAGWFTDRDVLLTPTLAQPPPPVGSMGPKRHELMALAVLRALPSKRALRAALDALADDGFELAAFTPVANLAGQPAMSVPLHWNRAGLPIGAHFIARFGDEGLLFRLAAQLEKARPWAERRPEGFA